MGYHYLRKKLLFPLIYVVIGLLFFTGCSGGESIPASSQAQQSKTSVGQLEIYDHVTTSGKVQLPAAEPGTFTVLVYLNGSDLESEGGSATDDLQEMMAVGSTEKVNIIVQTGGTNQWEIPEISSDINQRWRVLNGELEKIEDVGEVSMGNPQTLYDFLIWGMQNYPAEKTALVCWNHGAGSIWGYAVDELNDGDSLLLNELKDAVASAYDSTGRKLELVGFDACLMATLETASIFSPYANYLIASEETEPAHGWNYTPILQALTSEPQINGDKLGRIIVDSYRQHAGEQGTGDCITLSVMDLAKAANVVDSVAALMQKIQDAFEKNDNATLIEVTKARLDAEAYGDSGAHGGVTDMVDIADFAKKIKAKGLFSKECDQVVAAVKNCAVYSLASSAKPDAKGISIYFPGKDRENFETKGAVFSDLDFNDAYKKIVAMQTEYLLAVDSGVTFEGKPSSALSGTKSSAPGGKDLAVGDIEGDENYFSISVKPEDIDRIYDVFMVIGRYTDQSFKKVHILGRDTSYEIDEKTGLITSEVSDAWETLNGNFITLDLLEEEESYALYAIPALLNKEDVDILVLYNDEYPDGKILGARPYDEENKKVQAKDLIQIRKGDRITPLLEYETSDGDCGYEEGKEFVVKDKLLIEAQALPPGDYVYGFEIVDIYQNVTYSDWVEYIYE